jgi:hypothetical protein
MQEKLSLLADTHDAKGKSMSMCLLIMLNRELKKKKKTTIAFFT